MSEVVTITTASVLARFYAELIATDLPANLIHEVVLAFAREHMSAGIQLEARNGR